MEGVSLETVLVNHIHISEFLKIFDFKKFELDQYFCLAHVFTESTIDLSISRNILMFIYNNDPSNCVVLSYIAHNYIQDESQMAAEFFIHQALKINPKFLITLYVKFKIYERFEYYS